MKGFLVIADILYRDLSDADDAVNELVKHWSSLIIFVPYHNHEAGS